MEKFSHATTMKNILTYKYGGNFPIDIEECKCSNLLLTGTNQVGKSFTAMAISDILMRNYPEPWRIIVVDNVGHWKNKSTIPYFFQVSDKTMKFMLPRTESIIFDTSFLLPTFQREFLESLLQDVWEMQLNQANQWVLICLEESHLFMRNIRSMVSQALMRICSVGANWKIRTLAISPSLTGIDPEFIRLAQQRWHFKLGIESNALRRFRGYYSKDWCRVARELESRFCIYLNKDKLKVWKIPTFRQDIRPRPWQEPKTKKKGLLARIFGTSGEIDVDSDGVIMEGEDLLEEMFEDD